MKETSILILKIDTTNREEIILGLYNTKIKTKIYKTEKQSEDILVFLNQFVLGLGYKIDDLAAVLVNISPGSYTGVRVGVTVANTLAWSLNIPVLGYQQNEFEKVQQYAKKTPSKFSKLALPTYSDVV